MASVGGSTNGAASLTGPACRASLVAGDAARHYGLMRTTAREDANSVLERALVLLGAFTSERPTLRIPELVEHTRLPKATVYRLAAQLEAAGLIERDGSALRLGLRLFEMGQLAPRQRVVHDAALPYMHDLREATQETVHLAVLDGTQVVYVEKIVGRGGPLLPSQVGGRMPLHCTGLGKVLLAFQTQAFIKEVISAGLEQRTPYTIRAPGHLLRELADVRKTGLAYEREESTVGVVCVAAPIMDAERSPVAALSIAGWSNRLDVKRVSAAAQATSMAIARELLRRERPAATFATHAGRR